jgi:hypothetical protein
MQNVNATKIKKSKSHYFSFGTYFISYKLNFIAVFLKFHETTSVTMQVKGLAKTLKKSTFLNKN